MANAFNQFSEGYNQGQDMAQGFARQQAGNSLANGDYGGAANTLYRSGQLDTGSSVQNFGNAQHKQEVADRLEFFGKAAAALAQIPDDGTQTARKAALAHLTPTFQAMGMKPADIQQLQSADLSNASLSAFGANLAKQLELIKGNDGELGTWNAATGTYSQIRAPQYEQKYVPVPEGGKLVPIPRGDQPPTVVDPGASSPASPSTAPAAPRGNPQDIVAPLVGLGARMTSGLRTPAHNAAVGGVPNSDHLTGQAADLVPPQGMTLAQLGDEAKRRIPGAQVIVEGDHVHVEWGPGAHRGAALRATSGDPVGTIYGNPKPRNEWVPLSADEAKAYGPGQYQRNATTGEVKQVSGTGGKSGKLSGTALNIQNGHIESLQTASAINTRLDNIARQMDSGALKIGPVTNLLDRGRNVVGMSDAQSRNFASFRANLEKLRNDSLRLNKGVQTEGDAQRAWAELMASLNDEGVVRQRLDEIRGYNEQAVAFHQDAVDQLREDAGLPPIDTRRFIAKPPGASRNPPAKTGNTRPPLSAFQR